MTTQNPNETPEVTENPEIKETPPLTDYQKSLLEQGYGICCICGDGCNPHSQSCGRCARDLTMFMIGMKPPTKTVIDYLKLEEPEE